MMELLLLGNDTQDLAALFENAGYEVVEVRDAVACCRRLRGAAPAQATSRLPDMLAGGPLRGVTIFSPGNRPAEPSGEGRPSRLLDCILSLARQLNPGWHLSMRYHRLDAPNGASMRLTSLEFNFIKIFAMAEIGETVSRKQIVQAFGEDYLTYDQNRIDTMVRRLRQKAETDLHMKLPLNTERVRGYSFGDLLIIDP
jgi:hypothetical protein